MRKSEAKLVIRDAIKAIDKTEVRTSAPTMYRDKAMADAARARDILAGVSWGLSEALEALETDEDGFDVTPDVKEKLLSGLDAIGLTLAHEADIAAFEAKHDVQMA